MTTQQELGPFEAAMARDDRFIEALRRLAGLLSYGRAQQLLGDLAALSSALAEQRPRAVTAPSAAAMMIALLHARFGLPAYFDDDLFDAWCCSDGVSVSDCPRDGYRVPAGVTECPVCGGATGEAGGFFQRQNAAAARSVAVN